MLSAFQKHTCRCFREETHSEKYTDPCKTHHTQPLTPRYWTDTTQTPSRDGRLRNTPSHTARHDTPSHRQTRLAAVPDGQTLRQCQTYRKYTAYAGADLVHKPTQIYYTQVLSPAEIHRPTPARRAQTPPITQTPPLHLPQRQQTADPGRPPPGLAHPGSQDTHSQETHEQTHTHAHTLAVTLQPHRNTGYPGPCLPGAHVYKLLFSRLHEASFH